jgi:hypothetical protein
MLCGGLTPAPITRAMGRAVIDLPVSRESTLLELWERRLAALGVFEAGLKAVMLHTRDIPGPTISDDRRERFVVRVEPDGLRGPAGAVRDAVGHGDAGEYVLVVEANRYPGASLSPLMTQARRGGEDVIVAANPGDEPGGAYLIRRGVLELVPPEGFMDLKEQLLGRAADRGKRMAVVELAGPGAKAVRTRRDLLAAAGAEARTLGRVVDRLSVAQRPVVLAEENWPSVVRPGADIAAGAVLVESIVMAGAHVLEGAVVVRSVVAPGVTIPAGAQVVDAVVTREGVRYDADESVVRFHWKRRG